MKTLSSDRAPERRRAANDARGRVRLAMVAFLAHAPGLYLLAGRTLEPRWIRLNAAAAAATLALMVGSGLALRDQGLAGAGVAGAWAVGHMAWSLALARGVLQGGALRERRKVPRG